MNGLREKERRLFNIQPQQNSLKFRFVTTKRKYSSLFVISTIFFDAACLILCFYIIKSPIVLQPGINIQLPQVEFTGGAILNTSMLSISHDGTFFYENERVNSDILQKYLIDKVKNNPEIILIIEADERVEHGKLVEAWTIARLSGVNQISLATGLKAKE